MVELKDCVKSRKLVKAKFGQIEKLHHIEKRSKLKYQLHLKNWVES